MAQKRPAIGKKIEAKALLYINKLLTTVQICNKTALQFWANS